MEAPREFTRSIPFELERASEDGDGLTLSGHAAVFNDPTRIDSWEGTFDEQIAPGAFKRTINSRTPVLMFDHGQHPLYGSMPIGQIRSIREDRKGLYFEARLHDNWLNEPLRDAIASGSIDGMSFRFEAIQDSWDSNGLDGSGSVPLRTLRELRVPEFGPVVFPAYAGTDVAVRMAEQFSQGFRDAFPAGADDALRQAFPSSLPEPVQPPDTSDTTTDIPDPQSPQHSGSTPSARERALKLSGVLK